MIRDRWALGVMGIAYRSFTTDPDVVARAARDDGFEFVDLPLGSVQGILPVGCPMSAPDPSAGWCVTPAFRPGEGQWEKTVAAFRAAPGCLMEAWAGGLVQTREEMLAMQAEVPGLRFLIDTGHTTAAGVDVLEVLDLADHVQLRQAARDRNQVAPDDPTGEVDFAAVFDRLEAVGYRGGLCIEYFDLPRYGWPLDDPRAWSVELATRLRSRH